MTLLHQSKKASQPKSAAPCFALQRRQLPETVPANASAHTEGRQLPDSFGFDFSTIPVNAPTSSKATNSPSIQLKASDHVLTRAAAGVAGTGRQLPHLERIQQAFGPYDVSAVQSFTAPRACHSIGAEAYTTQERVAFSGHPSLHLAAHEAAHVVQQRTGVHLQGSVGQPGDVYERHADAVANRVVSGQCAVPLLRQVSGQSADTRQAVQQNAVQMGIKSKIVTKLVKLLASLIRKGSDKVHHIIKYLDDAAADTFRRYSGRIADGLDEIAKIPDLTTRIVREKIYHYMVNELRIASGTALQIADAIEAVFWVLL